MKNKMNEKVMDREIELAIKDRDLEYLKELIGLSVDDITAIFESADNNQGKISSNLLEKMLLARDKNVLGLKKVKVYEIDVKDLNLDEEFRNYNAEILQDTEKSGKIRIMQGIDKKGKKNILYYYNDERFEWASRQMRTYNEHGDIESMSRQTMFSDGRSTHIDNILMAYKYDNHGNKKVGLYQDELEGMQYYEYDKNGNIVLSIGSEYIMQRIEEDGNSYTICDGYFDPTLNGFIYKGTPDFDKLKPEDIKRTVMGDMVADKRMELIDSIDLKRREDILSILKAVNPIFKSLESFETLDKMDSRRMQKVAQWFTGFGKTLKISPKAVSQDDNILKAMRKAVGKTIGNVHDAEIDLNLPAKDEKSYEGEEYEDI